MKNKILLLLCLLIASMVLVSCPDFFFGVHTDPDSLDNGYDSSRTFVFRGIGDNKHDDITKAKIDNIRYKAFTVNLFETNLGDTPVKADIKYYVLNVPEGVEYVTIFSGVDNYAKIILPEGVKKVEVHCGRVMKIVVPSTLESMVINAKLEEVDFTDSANSNFIVKYGENDNNNEYGSVYTKDGRTLVKVLSPHMKFKYASIPLTAEDIIKKESEGYEIRFNDGDFDNPVTFDYTVDDSVTKIGEYAFAGTRVKQVTIPSSVKKIEKLAFFECDSLTSVDDLNSVETFGTNLFQGCGEITKIPEKYLSSLSGKIEYEFQGCEKIGEYVTIPETVTEIGEGTFFGWEAGVTIEIKNPSIEISIYAFDAPSGDNYKDIKFAFNELSEASKSVYAFVSFVNSKPDYRINFKANNNGPLKLY